MNVRMLRPTYLANMSVHRYFRSYNLCYNIYQIDTVREMKWIANLDNEKKKKHYINIVGHKFTVWD